jgi:cell pole-organizing protein PopZ
MNALNPVAAYRDLEPLCPAREPSTEEMFAEIRSFITVDGERASSQSANAHIGPQNAHDETYSHPLPGADQLQALLKAEADRDAGASGPVAETQASSRPASEALASPTTEAAVGACFDALSACVAIQSAGVIEGLTRQMLRPVLTTWLNDNLPNIVERLVSAEIQRVARGGR